MTKSIKTFLFLALFFSSIAIAYAATGPYTTLVSLPNAPRTINPTDTDLYRYLDSLYKMGVAAAAGLAVIMVIWGGIQYITSAAGEGKGGGKERITSAILGLLLALGSYIILQTINPQLLRLGFTLPNAHIDMTAINTEYYVDDFSTYNPSGYVNGNYNFAFLNSMPTDSNGNVTFTAYGYAGDDTPDTNSSQARGNNNNLLTAGSVALSPDVISRLGPAHGAAVYVGGVKVGYYDDSTAASYNGKALTNRVDFFDPSGTLGGNSFSRRVSGNITVDNNDVRVQTPNP